MRGCSDMTTMAPKDRVKAEALAWIFATHDYPGYCETHLFTKVVKFAAPHS